MNRTLIHRRGLAIRIATLLGLALPALRAFALDYQIHGFAAQGYSLSEHNNYFGDSTKGGSTDYYEMGLNGAMSLTPDLLISAQGVMRRAGNTDAEGLRLDYAQIDYRFLSSSRYDAGLRLGRVKNPFGLYNETRDVVFTRPGISLPDSIYLDAQGLRSILFSSDGVQLYGGAQIGEHDITVEGNYALNSNFSSQQVKQLFGQNNLPFDIKLENFHVARLQDEWNGGMLKLALSYLHGKLAVDPNPDSPIEGYLTSNMLVASVRYNAERFALTSEYQLTQSRSDTNLVAPANTAGDGFYLQGEYHVLPRWTLMARYDADFLNRHDRDGREYAALTGGDRYSQFSHDETLGLNWQPNEHWGVWAEFHEVQGTAEVPYSDNVGRALANHWNLFQLMAGYRY